MVARLVIRDRGRGLTAAERTMIAEAFLEALRMANAASAQVDGIWNQKGGVVRRRRRRRNAWSAHDLFVRWFGDSTRIVLIRRLRRRMTRIQHWLDRGRIVVLVHDDDRRLCDGANAFAMIPRRPLKVHLCDPWFAGAVDWQASVVIHELVHELGFAHPAGATDEAAALALALADSRKARRSPENFQGCYLRL